MPTPYIVEIPSDVTALPIEGLGELLASTIYDAENEAENEDVKWACTALEFDRLIQQALERGQLLPRHPGTHTPSSTLPGSVLDVEELRDFLAANRWRVQLRIVTPEQEPQAAAPEPKAAPEWQGLAQNRAREIVKAYKERDWFPSQETIADTIASEFRAAGIMGTDGKPLSGATIKRHALRGISSAQDRQLSTSPRRGK